MQHCQCSPQVYNEQYFLVTMDDLCGIEESEGARRSFLCHRDSPGIFPAQWSLKNGLPLSPPPGTCCWIPTPGSPVSSIHCTEKWAGNSWFPGHLSRAGYQGPDFDWADYLKQCEAEAAPQQCFPTVSPLFILTTYLCLCQSVSHSSETRSNWA